MYPAYVQLHLRLCKVWDLLGVLDHFPCYVNTNDLFFLVVAVNTELANAVADVSS